MQRQFTTRAAEYRREFHKYPENGWTELRTSARIAELLTCMGYQQLKLGKEVIDPQAITPPVRLTEEQRAQEQARAQEQGANPTFLDRLAGYPGVIVEITGGRPGPVTAFRFDIDCLPYTEPREPGFRPFDEGYCSVNDNAVHACGHDGHTSIGLALAELLYPLQAQIKGVIRLIFQPAEETFSGAESVVSRGHLDDVDYFVAAHLALSGPNGEALPSHTMACGCKDFVSDCQLDVHFKGKSAHASGSPNLGKNALLAACSAALSIHSIAPHHEGKFRVNVGELRAGVCANTVAPNAMLRVEYRGENNNIAAYGRKRIEEIIDGAAKMYGLSYHIVDYGEVPTAKSDDAMMELVQRASAKVDWFKEVYFEGCVGGTDDAAVMIQRVQTHGGIGAYIGIGTDTTEPVHNARFDFDEDALDAAVELFYHLLKDIYQF